MGSKRQKMDLSTCSKGECPVCFQIPRAKVYQCTNGHSICDDCSEKVDVCPTCRSSGVRIRNLFAESLLDDMEFKCSWSGRGCDKRMWRGEISAHENKCDQNPDIIKFCSMFYKWETCSYKFTSKWLSEPENSTDFFNHVKTCISCPHSGTLRYGRRISLTLEFKRTLSEMAIEVKPAHHYYNPAFFRLPSLARGRGKYDVFFRVVLVKVDKLGNKIVSFPFVQLTPETTPIVAKFTINGNPSSTMVSKWGQNSLPALSWTQKTIDFKQFLEMVETSPNSSKSANPLPFSLPVSFLSEYYADQDKELDINVVLEPDS